MVTLMCQTNLHKDDYLLIKENQLDKWPIIAESKNIRGVLQCIVTVTSFIDENSSRIAIFLDETFNLIAQYSIECISSSITIWDFSF
jgi:hypothetical protein